MATWLVVVLAVLAALLAGLIGGGALANARRRRRQGGRFSAALDEVDRALADARADDRGWDIERLQQAARSAIEGRHPGEEVRALTLVQVVDRPGTEHDKAVFRARLGASAVRVTLGRVADEWTAESISEI